MERKCEGMPVLPEATENQYEEYSQPLNLKIEHENLVFKDECQEQSPRFEQLSERPDYAMDSSDIDEEIPIEKPVFKKKESQPKVTKSKAANLKLWEDFLNKSTPPSVAISLGFWLKEQTQLPAEA